MKAYLFIRKLNHKYLFVYRKGDETKLFLELVEYGKNYDYNLTLADALNIIKHINQNLKNSSFDFKLPA